MENFLKSVCAELINSSVQNAEIAIQNINEYFQVEQRSSELELAFSTIFNENNGILAFIISKFVVSQFSKPVAKAFQLLKYLLENFKERVNPHLKKMKDVCVQCLRRIDTTSEEKENAAELLTAIIPNSSFEPNEIRQFMKTMFDLMLSNKSTNNKTMPPKVMQKTYYLMGVLARHYEVPMQEEIGTLERLYFNELEFQTTRAAKVSFLMIHGCLTGFTESLYNFPLTNLENCMKLYGYLKKLADPGTEIARRFAQRAAVLLFAAHANLMADDIYKDYRSWHKTLLKWFGLSRDDAVAALKALDTFYLQVSIKLKDDVTGTGSSALEYFMKYFKEKMLSTDCSEYELRGVIKAFGCFSASCHTHLNPEDVDFMYILILQRVEHTYFENAGEEKMIVRHLPDYIQCLGKILMQLKNVNEEKVLPVQRIVIFLVEQFSSMPVTLHGASINCLVTIMEAFAVIDVAVLRKFLNVVVYQGIIRSCSHPVALDVELQKDLLFGDKSRLVSYRNYVPLWHALLMADTYIKTGLEIGLAESIVTIIYDQLMETLMKMTQKLNLTTRKKKQIDSVIEEEMPILDPESGLEACVPADFKLFINLADLFRDLMKNVKEDYFIKWVIPFFNHMVILAIRNPLVSGFYKLITFALKLCDKLEYFKNCGQYLNNEAVALREETEQRMPCYIMMCKFLRELTTRLKQFKGDLQISCLEAVLAAPVHLTNTFLPETAQVFVTMFKYGRSVLSSAHTALDELERWCNELPENDLKPLLTEVIPCLDPFLQSSGAREDVLDEAISARSRSGKRKRTPVQGRLLERPETDLFKLQKRILTFLSQLKSDTCTSLINSVDHEKCLAWDNTQHLLYAIPFVDMKPSIHLDKLVPRTLDLALNSSNRQTRIAACELLHSIIMYMLGTNRQMEVSKPGHLSKLFSKIMMLLLQLGCDSDQVVNQLFNPLMFQLARWYSSGLQLRSTHTQIFVETLMDGITHPTDASVRDFSAKCLREFVVWSIKQSTDEALEKSPINVKAVLKKMYSLCLHPCPTKRLGAALVFNSIYKSLREQTAIVEQFWVEILYYLVKNLSLSSHIEDFSGANEQIIAALGHVERVFKETSKTFNKANPKRRCPPELSDTKLHDVLLWLLVQCGSVQPDCRHKCMELVYSLAPLLPDTKSVQAFIRSCGREMIIKICEPENFTATPLTGNISAGNVTLWLNQLLAALDCYVWLIGEHLVEPTLLFEDKKALQSRLFVASQYFMNNIVRKNLEEALDLSDEDVMLCMPVEQEHYSTLKCSVIIRLFDFVTCVLKCKEGVRCISCILNDDLWNLINLCVFQPTTVGFNMDNIEVLNNLPVTLRDLLKSLSVATELSNLCKLLTESTELNLGNLLSKLPITIGKNVVSTEQLHYMEGLLILQNADILKKLEVDVGCSNFVNTIFSAMSVEVLSVKYVVEVTPSVHRYCQNLLKLAFIVENQVDVLLKCILDETKLKHKNDEIHLCLGEYFLTTFRDCIFDHMLKYADTSITGLLSVQSTRAYTVLSQLLKYLSQNHRQAETLEVTYTLIISCWENITAWAAISLENMSIILGVLYNLAHVLNEPVDSLRKHPPVSTWILKHLTNRDFPYYHKIRILDLLPFLTGPADENNPELNDSMNELRRNHFPQLSNELPIGSVESGQYILAFKKLLFALKLSGSRILLRSIISMVAMDTNHVCKDDIETALKSFIKRMNADDQLKALEVPYEVCTSTAYSSAIRLGTVKRFIRPLLEDSNVSAARKFYVKHIHDLKKTVEVDLKHCRTTQKKEQNIVARICAWTFIEIMFSKFERQELENPTCEITLASGMDCLETGRELIGLLTKKAYYTRDESCSDPEVGELFRQLQCAAYVALIAIISNTKHEPVHEKFYSNFIFSEIKAKNQFLWRNIVDCSYEYSFPLDWEEIPVRRKKLISIRQDGGANKRLSKYINTRTQYLFESTLREDVTLFDFTTSSLVPSEETTSNNNASNIEVALEDVSLNDHECMPVLCGVIDHMVNLHICPETVPGEAVKLPPWMSALKQSLEDIQNPRNARLFILRLILNTEAVFRPFAKFWLYPILKTIMEGCFGTYLNHFLMDTVVMLLSWSTIAIPEKDIEMHAASEVLDFLMRNSHHNRRDVFKHNLEVLKTMVEVWKPCLQVKKQFLYDAIEVKGIDSLDTEVGIQLVGIFLANNIEPWSHTTKSMFLKRLLQNIESNKSEVYMPCAEVLGMALTVLGFGKSQLPEDDGTFLQEIRMILNKQKALKNPDKFLHCLHGIFKHCSVIVDDFVNVLVFMIPKLFGNFKTMALEMICSRLQAIEGNVYLLLKDVGLLNFMINRDSDIQLLSLRIVFQMREQLEVSHLLELIPEISRLAKHHVKSCRQTAYDIAMSIYEKYKSTHGSDTERQIVEECKGILLEGFMDVDPELQKLVLRYWCKEEHLPASPAKRMAALFSNLYSPQADSYLLQYATWLLIEATTQSPDYTRKMFDHPLSDCKFEDYKVLVSWRAQHSTMAPMFANTLASQLSQSQGGTDFVVRATQDSLMFQPTVDTGETDVKDQFSKSLSTPSFSSSSLLYVVGSEDDSGPSFSERRTYDPRQFSKKTAGAQEINPLAYLKRRFLKSRKKISQQFAKREVGRKIRRLEMQEERMKKRDAQVEMYRKYRMGELPDIEILHSALIKPLQELAKCDVTIARVFLVSLFNGILKELSDDPLYIEFLHEMEEALNRILKNSVQCPAPLVGTMFEICLNNSERINLDAEQVLQVSRSSGLLSLGALIIEKKLSNLDDDDDLPAKRPKCTDDNSLWLKLAELYANLDEWDVVQGIFQDKVECKNSLRTALSAEGGGLWKKAKDKYKESLQESSSYVRDYCYQAYYKCLANLAEWENLNANVLDNTSDGDLNSLWDDSWSQEYILPWLFTSELQLQLAKYNGSLEQWNLLDAVNEWLSNKEKAIILRSKYSHELAAFFTLAKDFEQAKHHAAEGITMFLERWTHLSPLLPKLRYSALLELQKTFDLNAYLNFAAVCKFDEYEKEVYKLINIWNRRLPQENDSVILWDQRTKLRSGLVTQMKNGLMELCSDEVPVKITSLDFTKCKVGLAFAEMALKQNNFHVAKRVMLLCKPLLKDIADKSLLLRWKLVLSQARLIYSKLEDDDDAMKKLKSTFNSWNDLDVVLKDESLLNYVNLHALALQHQCAVSQSVMSQIVQSPHILNTAITDLKNRVSLPSEDSVEAVTSSLAQFGLQSLNKAADELLKSMDHKVSKDEVVADAYLQIAMFCRHASTESDFDNSAYESDILTSILRAMKYGSRKARQLFPCVLQLPSLSSDLSNVFKSECDGVPKWMFLSWVNQILASLDTKIGPVLINIVEGLASEYPQAIIYPLLLSSEKYKFERNSEGIKLESAVRRLKEMLLSNSIFETFLLAVRYISQPIDMVMYYVKSIYEYLEEKPPNMEKAESSFMLLMRDAFPPPRENPCLHGKVFNSVQKFREDIVKITGTNFLKVKDSKNVTSIIQSLKKLWTDLKNSKDQNAKKVFTPPKLLNDYSPWLNSFAERYASDLEIPGQYLGDERPLPQYHVKIVGFNKNVEVMAGSIRRPLLLTILGNDAKEHHYLVKFGEDLRQDQRIQQLFHVMNEILHEDQACLQRNLNIITYQVVPLSSSVGMIEWVESTKPLQTFITDSLEELEEEIFDKIRDLYISWLPGQSNAYSSYHKAYKKYSRNETIAKFRELVNEVPVDIVKRSIYAMSSSPEAFVTLRQNFVCSYSVLCICHWVLGIGDRHLSNSLISLKNAHCIGIDFGHSFGTATQFLPVPELMPFRLTPHIIDVMQPFGHTGLFEGTMIHVLKALRKNPDILLATMEVFVQEPSMDWLSFARRQRKDFRGTEKCEDEWFPRQKVTLCRYKLEGANPRTITEKELQSGVLKKEPVMRNILDILHGDQQHNVRAREKQFNLSVETQVACLIDQATDYHILGKTYSGWSPWV